MRRRVFPTKLAALDALEDASQAVFSECKDATSDNRRFVVQNAEAYARELLALPWQRRRTHEVLHANRPCRLFFDMESETMTEADMGAAVDRILTRVKAVWPQHSCTVLDGSRAGKQSRHVMVDLPVYFPGLEAMGREALRLAEDEPCVDRGVYAPGRTLRAPFCTGFGKTTRLRGGDETPEAFLKALVHVYRPDAPVMDGFVVPTKRLRVDGNPTWTDDELGDMLEHAQAWLLMHHWPEAKFAPNCRVQHSAHKTDASWSVSGIFCPVAGRVHKSNHTYVHLTLSARGPPPPPGGGGVSWTMRHTALVWCVCTDDACMATRRNTWRVANIPTALVGFQGAQGTSSSPLDETLDTSSVVSEEAAATA